jgi:hypothetical protein
MCQSELKREGLCSFQHRSSYAAPPPLRPIKVPAPRSTIAPSSRPLPTRDSSDSAKHLLDRASVGETQEARRTRRGCGLVPRSGKQPRLRQARSRCGASGKLTPPPPAARHAAGGCPRGFYYKHQCMALRSRWAAPPGRQRGLVNVRFAPKATQVKALAKPFRISAIENGRTHLLQGRIHAAPSIYVLELLP